MLIVCHLEAQPHRNPFMIDNEHARKENRNEQFALSFVIHVVSLEKSKYKIQLMLAHYSKIYAQFPLTLLVGGESWSIIQI